MKGAEGGDNLLRRNGLLDARRQTDLGGVGLLELRDDGAVRAGSTADLATVAGANLDVGNNGTFGHGL